MTTAFAENRRLQQAARRRAQALRRRAIRGFGSGLVRWLRGLQAATATRAPRSSSTSSPASSGKASPRQATC